MLRHPSKSPKRTMKVKTLPTRMKSMMQRSMRPLRESSSIKSSPAMKRLERKKNKRSIARKDMIKREKFTIKKDKKMRGIKREDPRGTMIIMDRMKEE
jgi:hypothetical protein